MEAQAITVSQFVGIINETLGFAYPHVVVEGEVSSFKINQGKFVFFDLKDDTNVLSCFMMIHQLRLPIEDGMRIRVVGTPKLTKSSKFSLTVRAIEIAGEGQLRRAMHMLERKLEAEGLFDDARKRPLPTYPKTIGLITSAQSAAYADFVKILGSRWGGVDVKLADVTVQGVTAPDQIVGALDYFNANTVDVVVLIRGGGSIEDLSAFSTEPVARAVAASRAPIIVGVGHEIDFSLADYAADVRAATPTDAARLVVPSRDEQLAQINQVQWRLMSGIDAALDARHLGIDRSLGQLEAYLRYPREQVAVVTANLWRALERFSARPKQLSGEVAAMSYRLSTFEREVLPAQISKHRQLTRLLHGFDPQATLARGYSIVRRNKELIVANNQVKVGDHLVIQFASGITHTEVTSSNE